MRLIDNLFNFSIYKSSIKNLLSRIYYYIPNLHIVFHLETGSVSKAYITTGNHNFKGALHFKNKYSHNF